MTITKEQIVAVTGAKLANVAASWPPILAALTAEEMPTTAVQIAAIATVAVECPKWIPQTEKYNGNALDYFTKMYEGRKDLGNTEKGDGARYCGRGFIQITGRANYRTYGKLMGVDLEGNPDLALVPANSAKILALFFKHRHIDVEAEAGNWVTVRRLVNGGRNSLNEFLDYVNALERLI